MCKEFVTLHFPPVANHSLLIETVFHFVKLESSKPKLWRASFVAILLLVAWSKCGAVRMMPRGFVQSHLCRLDGNELKDAGVEAIAMLAGSLLCLRQLL
jgi:hypothetical protein